jgi:excisionase family DNA binding protein
MRELNIEQRLKRIDENLMVVKQMLEMVLNKQGKGPSIEEDCEILTVKQAAQFLNLDPNAIYTKCAKGDLPYFKIGKGYRFKKEEILKWLEKKKEVPEISVDDFVSQYLQKNVLKA